MPTHEKMSTGFAVGICFGKIRNVQMDVEDHVERMKTDHRIGVCCQVVEQLLFLAIVCCVPFACLLAIVLSAMSTVRSTAWA